MGVGGWGLYSLAGNGRCVYASKKHARLMTLQMEYGNIYLRLDPCYHAVSLGMERMVCWFCLTKDDTATV